MRRGGMERPSVPAPSSCVPHCEQNLASGETRRPHTEQTRAGALTIGHYPLGVLCTPMAFGAPAARTMQDTLGTNYGSAVKLVW
jgi:hypothetical protein